MTLDDLHNWPFTIQFDVNLFLDFQVWNHLTFSDLQMTQIKLVDSY